MPINLTVARPKLNQTNNTSFDISAGTPTITGSKFIVPVYIDNLSPNSSPSFNCTYTNGSNQITFTNNTGKPISESVRLGDIITGDATAFPGGNKYVTAITESGTAITLTASANAAANGTGVALVFDPGAIKSTLYMVEIDHSATGSNLVANLKIHVFDGTAVEDANVDGEDDALISEATRVITLNSASINIDTFFNNARIDRTNA